MHHARSFFTVLFLVGSLAGATGAITAEDTSPPSVTSHEVNVLRQVAIALATGSDAIQDLRGPPIENSNLDRLKLAHARNGLRHRSIPYLCRMPQRFAQ